MKREHKLKILAFLISITLWYFIVWGKPIEKNFEIPVRVTNVNSKNYFWEINPSVINLKVVGTRSKIRTLNKESLKIEIDLINYPPGIHQFRIPIEKINLPEGIKIKEVNPNYITLIIRKISYKNVSLKIKFKDKPLQRNFKVMIIPQVVTLKGFWEDLKDISIAETEEIDFNELKKARALHVNVLKPERVLEVKPERVKIVYLSP